MANLPFLEAKYRAGAGLLDLASDPVRLMLLTSATSVFTEPDARDLLDFTTLAEYDNPDGTGPSGYLRHVATGKSWIRQVVPSPGVGKFTHADSIFTALALNGASDDVDAFLWYLHYSDTNDALNIPLWADNNAPLPYTPDGTDFRINWGANGVAAITA